MRTRTIQGWKTAIGLLECKRKLSSRQQHHLDALVAHTGLGDCTHPFNIGARSFDGTGGYDFHVALVDQIKRGGSQSDDLEPIQTTVHVGPHNELSSRMAMRRPPRLESSERVQSIKSTNGSDMRALS
jgi:hypothetical protein